MEDIVAFADEFGNNSFDFEKQGSHFIVASIICKKNNQKDLENQIEKIREKYFQTGQIKSNKVGNDFRRRKIILSELIKHDFGIYAVIVNKKELFGKGFYYKTSFYKYLNGILYKELFRSFPYLNLAIDEHGSNKFMSSFKQYVQKNHIRDLFKNSDINFIDSPDNVLIQLADFIAGTLGYIYDDSKKTNESTELKNMLKNKISGLNFFPEEKLTYKYEVIDEEEDYNEEIANLSIIRALDYININKSKEQDEIDRVNCVKYLLLVFGVFNYNNFISTKEIIKQLQFNRSEEISEHYFRTSIIAKIRDEGVLITSCSSGERTGYKLPSSSGDIYRYVNHGNNVILPMIKRLKSMRETIKLGTINGIDIFEYDEFIKLKQIVEIF